LDEYSELPSAQAFIRETKSSYSKETNICVNKTYIHKQLIPVCLEEYSELPSAQAFIRETNLFILKGD